MKEAALHRAVAEYLTYAMPMSCFWTTFPAGGGGRVRGANLKAMGLRAGVPDILVIKPSNLYGSTQTLWIELKRPKGGSLSMAQDICHHHLKAAGCQVETCRSVDEVQEALIGFGIAVKASTRRAA